MAQRTAGNLNISCNQTGVEFSDDLNLALSAINSMHYGTSPPLYGLENGAMWMDSGSTRLIHRDTNYTVPTVTEINGFYKITSVVANNETVWTYFGGPSFAKVGDIFQATAIASATELSNLGTVQKIDVIVNPTNIRVYLDSANITAIDASGIRSGRVYKITSAGNTDFTTMGSPDNLADTVFLSDTTPTSETGGGVVIEINSKFVPLIDFLSVNNTGLAIAGSTPYFNLKGGIRFSDGTIMTTASSGGGSSSLEDLLDTDLTTDYCLMPNICLDTSNADVTSTYGTEVLCIANTGYTWGQPPTVPTHSSTCGVAGGVWTNPPIVDGHHLTYDLSRNKWISSAGVSGSTEASIGGTDSIIRYNETILNISHADVNQDIFIGGTAGANQGQDGIINASTYGPISIDPAVTVVVHGASTWTIT